LLTATPHLGLNQSNQVYSSKVETARTDDDFQDFAADDNFEVRPEATPNHQPFVITPHASQTFAYPGLRIR
jgi:hypothetical protein